MIDHTDNVIDLNAVLHPGSVYDHPRDVVADTTLSIGEKRAILASWASDAAAVASNPALRELSGSSRIVTIDEILEALSALDTAPKGPPGGKPARVRQHRELRWPRESGARRPAPCRPMLPARIRRSRGRRCGARNRIVFV